MGKTIVISKPDEKQIVVSAPSVKGVVIEPQTRGGGGVGSCLFTQAAVEGAVAPVLEAARATNEFFGLPESLPQYTALTPAEAIAIARDCQYNVMGTDWPIPTWLPTGVTEAQVESAAEGLGIPYHEPTQTA